MTSIHEVYGTEETHEELLERGIDIDFSFMDKETMGEILKLAVSTLNPRFEMMRRANALALAIENDDYTTKERSQAVGEYTRLLVELDKELD